MNKKPKRPKRRIPLPKKTEKVHKDRSKYSRKKKYKDDDAEQQQNEQRKNHLLPQAARKRKHPVDNIRLNDYLAPYD